MAAFLIICCNNLVDSVSINFFRLKIKTFGTTWRVTLYMVTITNVYCGDLILQQRWLACSVEQSPRTSWRAWPSRRACSRRPPCGHGCQMAKFDSFFSLDCVRSEGGERNPRKGRDQILQRSVAQSHSPEARRAKHIRSKNLAILQPCLRLASASLESSDARRIPSTSERRFAFSARTPSTWWRGKEVELTRFLEQVKSVTVQGKAGV